MERFPVSDQLNLPLLAGRSLYLVPAAVDTMSLFQALLAPHRHYATWPNTIFCPSPFRRSMKPRSHACAIARLRCSGLTKTGSSASPVVKSGEVEIVDCSDDAPQRITVHRPGQFTGDVSHLTGAPAVVTAVARDHGEVLEITSAALRRVLN